MGNSLVGDVDRLDRLLSREYASLCDERLGAVLTGSFPLLVSARGVWSWSMFTSAASRFPAGRLGVAGSMRSMSSGESDEFDAKLECRIFERGGEIGRCRLRDSLSFNDRRRLSARSLSSGEVGTD